MIDPSAASGYAIRSGSFEVIGFNSAPKGAERTRLQYVQFGRSTFDLIDIELRRMIWQAIRYVLLKINGKLLENRRRKRKANWKTVQIVLCVVTKIYTT